MSQAIYLLANRDESYQFKTGAEVLKVTLPVLPTYPETVPAPCAQASLEAAPSQSVSTGLATVTGL